MTDKKEIEPPLFIDNTAENAALLDEMRSTKRINGNVLRGYHYSWSSGQPSKGKAQGWYRGEKVEGEWRESEGGRGFRLV